MDYLLLPFKLFLSYIKLFCQCWCLHCKTAGYSYEAVTAFEDVEGVILEGHTKSEHAKGIFSLE
jgi:hypothetical protein